MSSFIAVRTLPQPNNGNDFGASLQTTCNCFHLFVIILQVMLSKFTCSVGTMSPRESKIDYVPCSLRPAVKNHEGKQEPKAQRLSTTLDFLIHLIFFIRRSICILIYIDAHAPHCCSQTKLPWKHKIFLCQKHQS